METSIEKPPFVPRQKYNVLMSLATIEDAILQPERLKSFYEELKRAKLATGDPVLKLNEHNQKIAILTNPATGQPSQWKNKDLILKGLDILQIGQLVTLIDNSPDLGNFRLWASGSLRRLDPLSGRLMVFDEGDLRKQRQDLTWGEPLPPVLIDRQRDPSRQLWAIRFTLANLQDEPINSAAWRSLYYQCEAQELTHSKEPEFSPKKQNELILRRMQPPQMCELLKLIDSIPEVGSFILTGGSDLRRPRPKTIEEQTAEAFSLHPVSDKYVQSLQNYYDKKEAREKEQAKK